MNILVLGGTRFIGRHIVEAFLAAGDQVAVFARGKSPDELPEGVERLRGDRNGGMAGLDTLTNRSWDACVDVSGYTPQQVRPSAELLDKRVGRYVFVSTVSVYADSADVPVRETHPVLPESAEDVTEVTADTYGPLKVTCERIVRDTYGERCTILRPQIVAGPHDPTGRHTYWVQRATQGGDMLAPGDGNDFVQVVDARDIARFTRTIVDAGMSGIFNMAGPRLTWAAFMRSLGAVQPVWVGADLIAAAGVTFTELPLFIPNGSPRSSVMNVSAGRALDAGFTWTEPGVTVADTRDWLRVHAITPALTAERERELIAEARRGRSRS